MKDLKRIIDWDSEENYWICPYCEHKNKLEFWPSIEECEKCERKQEFDTDYICAYEGMITINYIGPKGD